MKVKFFLASLVFFFALLSSFVSCSLGRDEGTVKIAIPSRAALSRSRNSAARAVDGEYISIFIVGDYEDKKTIPFVETAQTVTFDSIPAGAAVRVVCTYNIYHSGEEQATNWKLGSIGVSDEIVIVGGEAQTANVVMKNIELYRSANIAKLCYVEDEGGSYISLPGSCSYEFKFESGAGPFSYATSSAIYALPEGSTADAFSVTARIFFDGTCVLKLYGYSDAFGG